jgi:D-3-phosphoglycerate dehydrogenase
LTALGDYRTDAFIDGILLLFSHRDAPGVIGFVGQILAEDNVNISQMAVGRVDNSRGGDAIGVLNLDSPASTEALARFTQLQGINSIRMIELPAEHETPEWLA